MNLTQSNFLLPVSIVFLLPFIFMRILTIDLDNKWAYLEDGCRRIHITGNGLYRIKTYKESQCISDWTGEYGSIGSLKWNEIATYDPVVMWAIRGLLGVPSI